jgi:uncharacterized protein
MDNLILTPLALGIFVGILMGLTGAGGGILSVPLLVFFLHLKVAVAGPVALTAIAISAGVGAFLGLKNKLLRYKAAGFMAIIGLLLSPAGLWLAQRIPNHPLLILFSCILFFVSGRLYLEARREILGIAPASRNPPPCLINPEHGRLTWNLPCAKVLLLSGGLAGFLSGLLGVGGGFIIVPALKRYTNLTVQSMVATSLGVLAIVSSGSAIVSAVTGNLALNIAIPFSLGAIVGLLIGRGLGKKLRGPRVQQIFAILTFGVAINLMIKGLSN